MYIGIAAFAREGNKTKARSINIRENKILRLSLLFQISKDEKSGKTPLYTLISYMPLQIGLILGIITLSSGEMNPSIAGYSIASSFLISLFGFVINLSSYREKQKEIDTGESNKEKDKSDKDGFY